MPIFIAAGIAGIVAFLLYLFWGGDVDLDAKARAIMLSTVEDHFREELDSLSEERDKIQATLAATRAELDAIENAAYVLVSSVGVEDSTVSEALQDVGDYIQTIESNYETAEARNVALTNTCEKLEGQARAAQENLAMEKASWARLFNE